MRYRDFLTGPKIFKIKPTVLGYPKNWRKTEEPKYMVPSREVFALHRVFRTESKRHSKHAHCSPVVTMFQILAICQIVGGFLCGIPLCGDDWVQQFFKEFLVLEKAVDGFGIPNSPANFLLASVWHNSCAWHHNHAPQMRWNPGPQFWCYVKSIHNLCWW